MKYKIYRNLHNGKLSVKDSVSGLVVGHCDAVQMSEVEFKVSELGVARIRREKRKAVVATVNGTIAAIKGFVGFHGRNVVVDKSSRQYIPTMRVYFNPYKYTSFVDEVGDKVGKADCAVVESTGLMLVRR